MQPLDLRTLYAREAAERGFSADPIQQAAVDRKSTRLNSSHSRKSRMPSSA